MQSHHFGRTCRLVESNAAKSLAVSFSSIGDALFAAIEMADRADEPCLMCGVAPEEPERWARGTQPMPISEPVVGRSELCEPDMIFTASATPLRRVEPVGDPAQRNVILVALGAILMALGAHYIFTSLGVRR